MGAKGESLILPRKQKRKTKYTEEEGKGSAKSVKRSLNSNRTLSSMKMIENHFEHRLGVAFALKFGEKKRLMCLTLRLAT